MTREDIIRMAREAGIDFEPQKALNGQILDFTDGSQSIERVTRFAALVAAAEREACAQVCEAQIETGAHIRCANAIRARGKL